MFKGLIFLFIFSCCAFGIDYLVLKKEYSFSAQNVYAKDLFKEIASDFLVLKIPNSSNIYQVKSSQIIAAFESEGISVGAESPIITFKREFSGEKTGIKNHILAEFLREYKKNNIQIEAIHLEQVTPLHFEDNAILSIDFHSKLLKRNEGSFDVIVQEKIGAQMRNRKVYFRYTIDAKIQAIKTINPISGRQSVDYSNAQAVWIPFTRISSPLMQENEMGKVAVRSYTPKDVIITKERLIAKRVVKRGDKMIVSVIENGVLLEFTLEAQKDGAVGDIIKARAMNTEKISNKKVYDVEVLEEGRGRLL